MSRDTRIVGERGQITIPKDLRERFGIRGGDEVVVRAEDDQIVIAQRTVDDRLEEGYREQADRDRRVARERRLAVKSADGRTAGEADADADNAGDRTPDDAPAW